MSTATTKSDEIAAKVSETINETTDGVKKAITLTYPLLISNKNYTTSSAFPVHSPATGKLLHYFSSASITDAEHAIASAQEAFLAWRALPPQKKRDIFLRAADIMDSRRKELIKFSAAETGATAGWIASDATLASNIIRDIAGRISSITSSIPITAQENVSAHVFKEPYGVILSIAPRNGAYILGVRSVVCPLAASNTVVLKAPEFSPMSSYAIVSCFHDAGLPKGVLNLIAYNPSDTAAITKHLISLPSIKKVTFTGSPILGKIIAKLAGENLKPIVLELEGRVPAIVLDDADLELAAMDCAIGSFKHSGQIYMSTTRLIVHEKISSEFEIAFKKALRQFEPKGYVADSLINKAAVEKNKKLLQDAISNGATIVYGDPMNWQDARMRPVIVKGLTKKMGLYHTESFGTTVSLITVKSDEEALELANDVEYGLPTTIYTKDLERGLWFARDIESGAVYINGTTVHNETVLPYSGIKASQYGGFVSSGLEKWVRTKTVTFKANSS